MGKKITTHWGGYGSFPGKVNRSHTKREVGTISREVLRRQRQLAKGMIREGAVPRGGRA